MISSKSNIIYLEVLLESYFMLLYTLHKSALQETLVMWGRKVVIYFMWGR